MSFAQILPMAFVMIAGPQIITSFFLATSPGWARTSLAYVGGAAISITGFVSAAYLLAAGVKSSTTSDHTTNRVLDWVILVLVLILIARVYLTRKTSRPPKWMGKLQEAKPKFTFTLGLLLLGVFPTDILTSVTCGLHVARHDDRWWQVLPFVGLTLLFLALPAIGVVLLGKRAESVLPKIRDWMNTKSWVVSLIVLVFFLALTINSLVG
ncbi:MAG TPA: GAP family protein [Gaiellaceae bacterium]|nr:GAP family protein [Gaiellaceae bacterium]